MYVKVSTKDLNFVTPMNVTVVDAERVFEYNAR
jgi:hypothetical protein